MAGKTAQWIPGKTSFSRDDTWGCTYGSFYNLFPQIPPVGVSFFNKLNFPVSAPALDPLFAQYGLLNIIEGFIPDQPFQAVSAGKSFNVALPVFMHPAHQIIRYTGIERAVPSVGQYVNEIAPGQHAAILTQVSRVTPEISSEIIRGLCGGGAAQWVPDKTAVFPG